MLVQKQTTFKKDPTGKKIIVEREFHASPEKVWKAWTNKEILDQWWAPKPWVAKTKKMDFSEGGRWLYSMTGPDGERHWSLADFKKIEPQKSFTATDAFCDEEGKIKEDMPRGTWTVKFSEAGENTLVTVEITSEREEDLNKLVDMGFESGFASAHQNLDEILDKEKM